MNETNVQEARLVTTPEQAHSAIGRGIPLTILLKHSPIFLRLTAERRELVRLVAPLYKEIHCSVPYYANRPLDDPFWFNYVGSRVNEARALVEAHRNSIGSSTTSPATPPSNG